MGNNKEYDCQRGCEKQINEHSGETCCKYNPRCCKLSVFDWLDGISQEDMKDFFEVRFKNTRKLIFRNESGQNLKMGDIVVVEAQNGYDVGIITLAGPIIARQMKRDRIDPTSYSFRKIYRKARPADIERWQNAIAREHKTMIKSRQIAAGLQLDMKIGDVEFQGDGSKAIFYYIADERVDFRQLIKDFAEEFRIRIEMKQIGARQEAGLIGGLGVCGQALCCSRYMSDFQSITTQAARCQDLSLNPQKLAGQCGKLKCCINYEASTYIDAQSRIPKVSEPLQLEDGEAYLMKTDILKGLMWFSYDPHSMSNMVTLTAREAREIIMQNRNGIKPATLLKDNLSEKHTEFMSAAGEESISRFDKEKKKRGGKNRGGKGGGESRDGRRNGRPDRKKGERNDKAERQERAEKQDKQERQERAEKTERKERRENGDRPERNRNNRRRQPKEPRESKAPGENRTPRENGSTGEPRAPRENREDRKPAKANEE